MIMRWIVILGGGEGPDVWVNEEKTVEAEDIKEAVDKAIEWVESEDDLSVRNIIEIGRAHV